jgi:hypothetical protein
LINSVTTPALRILLYFPDFTAVKLLKNPFYFREALPEMVHQQAHTMSEKNIYAVSGQYLEGSAYT